VPNFINTIYLIIAFRPIVNFVIRLCNKELSEVSYVKFDTVMLIDHMPIYRQINGTHKSMRKTTEG